MQDNGKPNPYALQLWTQTSREMQKDIQMNAP